MGKIRSFEYRPCRIRTGFAVDFESAGKTSQGICRNVAECGIQVEFASPVALGEVGQLTLYRAGRFFQIRAEVAYVEELEAGLTFRFRNPEEKEKAAEFTSFCASPSR